MNTFDKYSMRPKSTGKTNRFANSARLRLLSLLLMACTLLAACSDEVDEYIPTDAQSKLSITIGLNQTESRGIITGNTLPDGSEIGILLDDGTSTDYDNIDNIRFTAATQDGLQKWSPDKPVYLTKTPGSLYAYYPYKAGTDLSAIPVDVSSQIDYLYAEPVKNVNEDKSNVSITLKHMLTNIKVSIARGTYEGIGNISNITIHSQGFGTTGTFNAAQESPAFVTTQGADNAIPQSVTTTLGGTATDILVVPTGETKPITVTATIDDKEYTVSSDEVTLNNGSSYQYSLNLNATKLEIVGISIEPWATVAKDDLTLQKPGAWDNIANGVYAVSAEGEPVDVNDADESCIAVALVVNDARTPQRMMIEKNESDNTEWNGEEAIYISTYDDDYINLPNYFYMDASNANGYLKQNSGSYAGTPNVTSDYKTWDNGALSDLKGKANTSEMLSLHTTDIYIPMYYATEILNHFNANLNANQGFSDWYIPSLGQMALIYMNMNEINVALDKIGGKIFSPSYYWSNTERDGWNTWAVNFENGYINQFGRQSRILHVRFIRDIQ